MDRDVFSAAHELMWQRPTEQLREYPTTRAADHDLGDVFEASEAQKLGRKIIADQCLGFAFERLGELHGLVQAPTRRLIELAARPLDRDGDPWRVHQVGEPLCRAHDLERVLIRPDAGKNALASGPRALDGVGLHALDEIGVDALRGAPQRELAQCRQVLRLEEVLNGTEGSVLDIDFAFGQPLQELVGRKIDQHDFVGVIEHGVGHRLAHPDLGDLLNDIV